MIAVLFAVVVVAVFVYLGEVLQKKMHYHPEITRKFVHITVATFAATWPFFMSWSHIELLSLVLFLGVLLSKRLHYFPAIHGVQRLTWGEIFFPVSVGMAALISKDAWVYAAAMLHLGLADGLAATFGTLWGEHHRYKVLGHVKTRIGTITFYICSFLILLFCAVLFGPHDSWTVLLWLPVAATIFENVGIAGSDNFLVPMLIAVML